MVTRIASFILITLAVLSKTYSQGEAGLHLSYNLDVFRVESLDGDYINKEFYRTSTFADMSASRISVGWYWRKNQQHTQEVFASVSSDAPIPYTYYEREDVPPSFDFLYLSIGYQSVYTISKTESRSTALGFSSSLYQLNFTDISDNRYVGVGDIQQETLGLLFNLVLKHTYSLKRFAFGITSTFRMMNFNYSRHLDNNIGRYPDDNIDNILSKGFSLKLFPAAFSIGLSVGYKFKSE